MTDAISALGLGDGDYDDLGGVRVRNGVALRADADGTPACGGRRTLAGAVAPLDACVRNFRAFTRCDDAAALAAASLHPARALGLAPRKGTLEPGADADLVVLDDELRVLATYVRGVEAWSRERTGETEQS